MLIGWCVGSLCYVCFFCFVVEGILGFGVVRVVVVVYGWVGLWLVKGCGLNLVCIIPPLSVDSVAYAHLTLPTICSVLILVCAVW